MPRRPWYTISSAVGTDDVPDFQTQASLDGTTDTGANNSSAQRRTRALPFSHSSNGVRQSRVNTGSFQPQRNERRVALSSDMGDTRAPAICIEHWDRDEVESFNDHVDDLFATQEAEHQDNANSHKDPDYWEVDVIENGVTKQMNLIVKEAIALPPGRKIVFQHNTELQAVGQAAGLLSEFLGSLGVDFSTITDL